MRINITLAAAAVVGLVLVPTAAANASGADHHCVVELIDISVVESAEPSPLCFDTEVLRDQYIASLTDPQARAAGSIVIGTAYKDESYGGDTLTFTGANGCVSATYGFPAISSDWARSISSAIGENGCWMTLYSATNYGGSRLNCSPSCPGIGSLNDQVWSVVLRPSGTYGR